MSSIEHPAFLARLKNGDTESLTALYAAYHKPVYTLALRMLGNQAEAEDITHETFLQVYQHLADFQGKSQISTWIYTIAKHHCLRLIQRQKRTTFLAFETLINTASRQPLPEELSESERDALIAQVKEGCLTGLVRCLPVTQRLAFILHVLMKLPMKTVAAVLEKSAGATKTLIHRARQRLKAFLCEHCSLYDPKNSCRCENLIHFSLSHGWITLPAGLKKKPESQIDPAQIEAELESVKKIVALYQNLTLPQSPEELGQRLQELITSHPGAIFSPQKV